MGWTIWCSKSEIEKILENMNDLKIVSKYRAFNKPDPGKYNHQKPKL